MIELICRRVWQYAIKAVMQDIRKKSRWLSFPEMSQRQQKRRHYEELHLRRMGALKKAEEPEEVLTVLL